MDEKIIEGLEILWNVFILSLFVIFFSMLVITAVPSFLAGISLTNQLKEKKLSKLEVNLSLFWKEFITYFWKGVIIQLSVVVILFIAYINFQIILQGISPVVSMIVTAITIGFLIIAIMVFLNLMYGITNKPWSRKLLDHSIILVFAKLPLLLLLSICYIVFFVSAFFLPQLLILTIGIIILIHQKTGSKIWGQLDPV